MNYNQLANYFVNNLKFLQDAGVVAELRREPRLLLSQLRVQAIAQAEQLRLSSNTFLLFIATLNNKTKKKYFLKSFKIFCVTIL